jgi:Glycosyltransferase family 9 (heptosyltransferase)
MINVMTKDYARQRLAELESICKYRPTSTLLADLAGCYFTLDQPERALPLSELAWDKNKNPAIGMNLALIYKDLGRHEDAFRTVEEAYWLNPDDEYIRLGYGEALLKAGHWKQAWPIYDNARPTQQGAMYDLRLPKNVREWDGSTLPEGHCLLVINEGGTGDRISYARWLPELTKRGINWKFYPYDELFPFFERIFPKERLVVDGTQAAPTHWTTTFSLPAKLNIGPMEVPPPLRLIPTPESIEKYKMARPDGLPVVGICYEAAERFQGDRKVRSLSEGQAIRLICQTGDKVHWVNLQHGKPMPFPVSNIPFTTWDDTAGLMTNLDAVVTVDTGVMHFAGSLNKPMAVLLPGNSCWKFLKSGKKLNLYPSAYFYRNKTRGFEDAINELVLAIRNGTAWPTVT